MFQKLFRPLIALLLAVLIAASPTTLQTAVAQTTQAKPRGINTSKRVERRTVHIKFTKDSEVSLSNGIFVSAQGVDLGALETALTGSQKISVEGRGNKATTREADPVGYALRNHFKVRFGRDVDVAAIATKLQALPFVEDAYVQQLPAPMPSPDFRTLQSFLKPAPTGVDKTFAASYPGSLGSGVKIVDIEYDWNHNHEDLIRARTARVPNGTPADPFAGSAPSANHGTAVLGELIATNDTSGVAGIANGASIELINAYNLERGWDVAGALRLAGTRTKAGDVILLEQQADGPSTADGDYVPIEWHPDVYDAVVALTKTGRIVVEAGGNGNQNLSDSSLFGASFPAGKPDSGALIVGAGAHCAGTQMRSRMYFSNYGNRIDVQGPGECVVTTGYGDMYGTTANNFYTQRFAGTSSASPVVAASAAVFSASYQKINGRAPTPLELRMLMVATGTPQNVAAGTLPGKIGAYPNLAKLLPSADTKAPSAPTNFKVAISAGKPLLTWTAATDNAKVSSYQIYRDGVLYKTVTGTSFHDTAAVSGRIYAYKVRALDAKPNYSAFTIQIKIAMPVSATSVTYLSR